MKPSSQKLWTEGEALERAGKSREAIDFFVRAAIEEENAGRSLRAKLLWEQIAERVGPTGTVLERIADASARAKIADEAFDYWVAAAARYHSEGRPEDASRAKRHATELKAKGAKLDPSREKPALAVKGLGGDTSFVSELLS